MTAWQLIYVIGAAQALLLAAALWRRPTDCHANRFLAGWMLLVCVDLCVRAWAQVDHSLTTFRLMRLVSLFPFLHASAFYLYVRTLISGQSLRWRDLRHTAGFAVALLASIQLLSMDAQSLRLVPPGQSLGFWRFGLWSDFFLFGYSLSYVSYAVATVLRRRRELRQTQSDHSPEALRWLMVVAASQCVIWLVALLQALLPNRWLANEAIYVAVAAWVLLAGYMSLLNSAAALASDAEDVKGAEDNSEDRPASDTAEDDQRFDDVAQRLEQLMAEGIYRQTALSIGQLAKRSGYPEYLVSAVINRRFGCPFWDYVNRHRVEAAKAHLLDPADTRTALEIAYDCGFSSKSTFNAAFKRFAGQTPSQCRRQIR